MTRIRVGIIGTGFGAAVHAPIFELHGGYEVKALTSIYRGKSQLAIQNSANKNIYTNWKEMLDKEELDLISITSAPVHHYEMALAALHKGVHVLCEKPLGMNTEQTLKLLQVQRESDVLACVNFQWRLTPIRLKIKEILENQELGEIQYLKYQGSFSGYRNLTSQYRGWDGRKRDGGGILFAVGSHMIDSLMWWMNQPIVDVYADLRTVVPFFDGSDGMEERDSEDCFTIIGHFQGGASFSADLYYPAMRGEGWKLGIFGTKGTLVMENDIDLRISFGGDFQEITIDRFEPPCDLTSPANHYYNGFYQMADFIFKSIQENKVANQHIPTFEDGHRVQLVLDAIEQSSLSATRISIKN